MVYCLKRYGLLVALVLPAWVWPQAKQEVLPSAPTSASASLVASPKAFPSLSELFAMAWQRHPSYASFTARQNQYTAQTQLAQSVLAGLPSASLGYRSDAINQGRSAATGLREWELGISVPLALGRRRQLATELARVNEQAFAAELNKTQWLLAAELREAYWEWQLAHLEHLLLEDEVKRAQHLVLDAGRRSAAGESPRVDILQAEAVLGLTRVNLIEAYQKETKALAVLQTLTGVKALQGLSDTALSTYQTETPKSALSPEHPLLTQAQSQLQLNKAKLQTALQVKGEPPQLGFGLNRETANDSSGLSTARINLSFALGTNKQLEAKVAQASAEAIESEVNLNRSNEQIERDIEVAKTALANALDKKQWAQRRATASASAAQLFAKAFSLGELDMPTRLRAEAERVASALALNRAVIEHAAAISKLNQLMGYLP